ncbi:MAG: ECF transporter S component [Pseudoclavibacter sp.]|nr:ECF transporter S component [Pseudoclavibacter sp.]
MTDLAQRDDTRDEEERRAASRAIAQPPLSARLGWRVVDIVVVAILAVAAGLVFRFWDGASAPFYEAMGAATPGLDGLVGGVWFIGGVLGAVIVNKPGAALLVEALGGLVSVVLGSPWGMETFYIAVAQGLGSELFVLPFRYRHRSRAGIALPAVCAGVGGAVGGWVYGLLFSGNLALGGEYLTISLVSTVVSGAVLAGALGWLLTVSLAATGALDRFPIGRLRARV